MIKFFKLTKHILKTVTMLPITSRNVTFCRKKVTRYINKSSKQFLQFDIVEYYPSISEELLKKALDFAKSTIPGVVDEKTVEIILSSNSTSKFHRSCQFDY